jgi:hypothetical protein
MRCLDELHEVITLEIGHGLLGRQRNIFPSLAHTAQADPSEALQLDSHSRDRVIRSAFRIPTRER